MAANDQLSSLSDAELRKAFIEAGHKPGPCIPSTRKTLESIYKKMKSGEDVSKFFTPTVAQAAPLSATSNVEEEEDQEQGRYSNISTAPRTPYVASPIAQSTPTPNYQFASSQHYEIVSPGVSGNENEHPRKYAERREVKITESIYSQSSSKVSALPVPIMQAAGPEQSHTAGPTATPMSKLHYVEKSGGDFLQSRPEVGVKTTTSSYYGGASSSAASSSVYQSSGRPGGFDPRLIQPREAVKSTYTPVTTGGSTSDLRQRYGRGASGSPATTKTSGAEKGGSSTFIVILFLIIALAIAAYFFVVKRSSFTSDDDQGLPKISGDAPIGVDE